MMGSTQVGSSFASKYSAGVEEAGSDKDTCLQ